MKNERRKTPTNFKCISSISSILVLLVVVVVVVVVVLASWREPEEGY